MKASGGKILVSLVALAAFAYAAAADAQDGVRQYKAAMTQIFLWRYSAFPIFKLNPVFPGSVVRLGNETIHLSPKRCYANPPYGNYRGIGDFKEGLSIATSADLRVKGQVVSKRLAEIEAKTGVKFARSAQITVAPLSFDPFLPDTAALRKVNPTNECKLILELLDGKAGGYVVTAAVLHGRVNYRLSTHVGANASAAARSELLALIAKVFALKAAEINATYDSVSFTVSASPGDMTLAIVPEVLSLEELSRITYYLQGKRGADLEIAVAKAISAGDAGTLSEMKIVLTNLLSDEIRNKDKWAENFVSGREMVRTQVLRSDFRERVDFRKVANYAAAMEIIR